MDLLLLDAGAEEAPRGAHEVSGIAAALEAHQVRAQQAVDDRPAPRQLGKDLRRREGDVVEEPDLQIRAGLAEQLGNQLELVVLDPDGGALGRMADDGVGEPPVDLPVGIPPGAVELRRGDHVVVERPQRGVGEALVEKLDVLGAQLDGDQVDAAVAERLDRLIRGAVPAHPGAVGLGHHRGQGCHQSAGGAAPAVLAAGLVGRTAVDGQPVGNHHEVDTGPLPRRRVAGAVGGRPRRVSGVCVRGRRVRCLHWCPLGLLVALIHPSRAESSVLFVRWAGVKET